MMNSAYLWSVLPALPLVTAFLLSRWGDRILPWSWLAAIPPLLAALVPPSSLALPLIWPECEWGSNDIITRGWLMMTGVVWACAGAFAASDLRHDPRRIRFWVFWQLALSGNLLLIIAQDVLSFYLGFSVMSLSAYGLIVHNGGPLPRRAGRLYLQLAILAEMLLFAGIVMRVHEGGGLYAFSRLATAPLGAWTCALIFLGFGIKAGFWPLHVWLPLAHPAAPAPASAVLSGAMIKAGVLGLWRFLPNGDPLLQDWSGAVLIIGVISAFYGVAMGLTRPRPKAVLAYSSVSQMGYIMVILGLAWRHPEQLYLVTPLLALFVVHHGLAKGSLFLAAGVVHSGRIPRAAWLLIALPALALAGLPFTSGGAVKYALKDVFSESDYAHWLIVLSFGSGATALLLTRALWLLKRSLPDEDGTRAPLGLIAPWAVLGALSLFLPYVWPLMWESGLKSLNPSAVWGGLWPIGAALALAGLALASGWQVPHWLSRAPNPALLFSLRFKRVQQRPPVPNFEPQVKPRRWRQRERLWNRFWRNDAVTLSGWFVCALILLGWLW